MITSRPILERFARASGTRATRRSPGKDSRGTPTIIEGPPKEPSGRAEPRGIVHPDKGQVSNGSVCGTREMRKSLRVIAAAADESAGGNERTEATLKVRAGWGA